MITNTNHFNKFLSWENKPSAKVSYLSLKHGLRLALGNEITVQVDFNVCSQLQIDNLTTKTDQCHFVLQMSTFHVTESVKPLYRGDSVGCIY